jgi:hypothetical protein
VLDEGVERRDRLRPGGGEQPRPVSPDEAHVSVPLAAVEVVADLPVDVVLLRPPRLGDAEGLVPTRRGLAVSASRFQRPPTGSSPSMRTPWRRRASR